MPNRPTTQRHRDPESFPSLVFELRVEAVLVVIASWMGPRLSDFLAPEDIWQETLLMAWGDRHRHEWQDLPTYRRWVLAIARNRVRDAAAAMSTRKRGGDVQRASTGAASDGPYPLDELPRASLSPSGLAIQRERSRAMAMALESLPEEFRDAVRLRLFEQLSLAEVAEQLGIAISTAKKRIYLGSRLYRDALRGVLSTLSPVLRNTAPCP